MPIRAVDVPVAWGPYDLVVFTCPVCGAAELTVPPYEAWPPPAGTHISPPYEDFLGAPSYEVCPNCGFEFGFDDNPGASLRADSFEAYRQNWEQSGSVRFSKNRRTDLTSTQPPQRAVGPALRAERRAQVFDVEAMRRVCERHGASMMPTDADAMIAVADNVQPGAQPINGLRHRQGTTSGWFIWAGELSDADDFFKPLHAAHLAERCPEVLPMLGLGEGWRSLLADGYEDVWFDAGLLADTV